MRAIPNDDWFKRLRTTAEGIRFVEYICARLSGVALANNNGGKPHGFDEGTNR